MLCWYEFVRLPGGGSIWTIVFKICHSQQKWCPGRGRLWVTCARAGEQIWPTDALDQCLKFYTDMHSTCSCFSSCDSVHFWRYYKLLPLFCRIYFMSPKKMGDIQPFLKTREYGKHCYNQPLKDKIPWTPVLILSMSTQVLSWVLRNDDKWIWFSNKLQPLTTSCN